MENEEKKPKVVQMPGQPGLGVIPTNEKLRAFLVKLTFHMNSGRKITGFLRATSPGMVEEESVGNWLIEQMSKPIPDIGQVLFSYSREDKPLELIKLKEIESIEFGHELIEKFNVEGLREFIVAGGQEPVGPQ